MYFTIVYCSTNTINRERERGREREKGKNQYIMNTYCSQIQVAFLDAIKQNKLTTKKDNNKRRVTKFKKRCNTHTELYYANFTKTIINAI